MNGPSCMYTLRPVIQLSEEIKLPKCMYSMKNIQTNVMNFNDAGDDIPVARLSSPHAAENRLNVLEQKPLPGMKDLEIRQEAILEQLALLKQQVTLLKATLNQPATNKSILQQGNKSTSQTPKLKNALFQHDIVINASPQHPPYFLLALSNVWKSNLRLQVTWHTHSNIVQAPKDSKNFMSTHWRTCTDENLPLVKISVVWKDVGIDSELVVSPMSRMAIRGDVNILRYLCRLGPSHFNYDDITNPALTSEIDTILDNCHCLVWSHTVKEKQAFVQALSDKLRKSQFFIGDRVTIADIAVWSLLKQRSDLSGLSATLTKWLQHCSEAFGIKA